VGWTDGAKVGRHVLCPYTIVRVGFFVGAVGAEVVRFVVGVRVGGLEVGLRDGRLLRTTVGNFVGLRVGFPEGPFVGRLVGCAGG
jgi:hypothetical protein